MPQVNRKSHRSKELNRNKKRGKVKAFQTWPSMYWRSDGRQSLDIKKQYNANQRKRNRHPNVKSKKKKPQQSSVDSNHFKLKIIYLDELKKNPFPSCFHWHFHPLRHLSQILFSLKKKKPKTQTNKNADLFGAFRVCTQSEGVCPRVRRNRKEKHFS